MYKKIIKKIKTIYWRLVSCMAMYVYGNPSTKLKIVGVTGTNGKTTTATLLYKVATELGYKAGLIGTVENIIAGDRRPATHTTPDSLTLTKLLKEMVDAGCTHVFMEVSSHALDQNRVRGVHFAGAIFTNLTHDHLDYHKSLEAYFKAKRKLFTMLDRHAFALSNADDGHGRLMIQHTQAVPFLYGFQGKENEVEFFGKVAHTSFSGLELTFNNIPVHSKLLGIFNTYNLLSVWSACSLLGFDMQKVNKILETIEPPRGRFDYFMSASGVLVVVDYAHTPDALEKIFKAVKDIKLEGSKIISVFGCGGDRDPLKRRIMGKIGADMSDIAIFTSDNPRNEDPDKIIAEMKTDLTLQMAEKVKTIADRREAIKESIKLAQKGDIILCAGKGHEDYQDIKGVKYHFDDVEEYKIAFK